MDGNGLVTGSNQTDYRNAFPAAVSYTGATALGCPSTGCQGYELSNDMDFDTNGNDSADSGRHLLEQRRGAGVPSAAGAITSPPRSRATATSCPTCTSNASTSADDSTPDIGGLFGSIGKGGAVKNLGLEDVNITVSSTGG